MVESRSPKPSVGGSSPSSPAKAKRYMDNLKRFYKYLIDTRHEIDKVTWPGKQEVIITTIIVFILACVCAVFLSIVDTMWYRLIKTLIGA